MQNQKLENHGPITNLIYESNIYNGFLYYMDAERDLFEAEQISAFADIGFD
jgi:hypothetical protein